MSKKLVIILTVCLFLFGMATRKEKENVEKMVESTTTEESKGNVEATTTVGGTTGGAMMNEPGKGTEIEEAPLIKPEEEPALYKTEISSITPKSGITTGHVIAYGHYIKPPYKVEIKNDTVLFINGVQIFPVFPSRLEIEKKRREQIWLDEKFGKARIIAEPYFKRKDSLFEEMRRVYGIIEPKEGRDKAIDSILKIAKTDTLIVEIKEPIFVGEDDCSFLIIYFMPGYDNTTGLLLQLHGGDSSSGYKPRSIPSRQDMNAIKKRQAIDIKDRTEKDLRNEYVVHYTYKDRGSFREYRLWQILGILKSDTFNMEEKIEKLSEITNENASKELIYNFAPSEWPIKNKEDKSQ